MSEADEAKAWRIVRSYLEGATPEQWHIYAARSNYDDNRRGLRWLLDQPSLQRATALLIYWQLGAAWYVQFAAEEDVASSSGRDTFALLREIEDRYRSGFYASDDIWFDPRHSIGGAPDDYPDLPVRRPIPSCMLEATEGRDYVNIEDGDPPGYDEGLPLAVMQALYELGD